MIDLCFAECLQDTSIITINNSSVSAHMCMYKPLYKHCVYLYHHSSGLGINRTYNYTLLDYSIYQHYLTLSRVSIKFVLVVFLFPLLCHLKDTNGCILVWILVVSSIDIKVKVWSQLLQPIGYIYFSRCKWYIYILKLNMIFSSLLLVLYNFVPKLWF